MKLFHGYYVVPATFLLNFVSLGTFYSAADLVVPLERTFGASRAAVDFLPSTYLCTALFASLVSGWLQDRLSRRSLPIQPVFAVGGVLLGIGPAGSSYASTLGGALSWAVLTGAGIGLTGFTAAGICVQWFDRDRGAMLLLAMAGSGLGNYAYSRGVQWLINYFADAASERAGGSPEDEAWREAMRVAGVFSMIVAVLSSAVMRLPKPLEVERHEGGIKDDSDDEHEAPLLAGSNADGYGGVELEMEPITERSSNDEHQSVHRCSTSCARDCLNRSIVRRNPKLCDNLRISGTSPMLRSSLPSAGDLESKLHGGRASLIVEADALSELLGTANPMRPEKELLMETELLPAPGMEQISLARAIRARTTCSLLLWSLLSSFGFTNFFVHVPSFAEYAGLSADSGAKALALTGLAMLIGNVTLGYVADKIGPLRTLQATMWALVVLVLAWPLCSSGLSLSLVAALYGYCSTTQPSMPLVILVDAFGESASSSILTLLGVLNVCKCPGYLLGPSTVGLLFDKYGSYAAGSLFSALAMMAANIALFAIPSPEDQKKLLSRR